MASKGEIDEDKVFAALLPLQRCEVPELAEQFVDEDSTADHVHRKLETNQILGPVPDEALLNATRSWLAELELTLEDLHSCTGLCKILGSDEQIDGYRKRYRMFVEGAKYADIPLENIPSLHDIRFERNWPKLLCAVAHLARFVDRERWDACLETAGATQPTRWRDVMRNESWEGDDTARQIARLVESHCTFVVAGTQGSGKSETLLTLLSRRLFSSSHALSYEQSPESMSEKQRSDIEKRRHLAVVNWPSFPLEENVPFGSAKVAMAHVKVDGVVLSFMELPEMSTAFDHLDRNMQIVNYEFGNLERVQRDIQGEHPRIILVVERLDDFCEKEFREHVTKLRRLFGTDLIYRMIVILTHGYSYPPGKMSYQVWIFDQIRRVRETLQKIWKKKCPEVPVVIVENSENCPIENGHRRIPNGSDFVQEFLNSVELVLRRGQRDFELVPTPPKGGGSIMFWWEQCVCYCGAFDEEDQVTI
ncbi:P-loop containing nucleoside triphosphate hydrolase [Gracilaria domingensis]|nr:P-loop containing nucleoside triphosphate hydrolase [Gracilaria domingensis]